MCASDYCLATQVSHTLYSTAYLSDGLEGVNTTLRYIAGFVTVMLFFHSCLITRQPATNQKMYSLQHEIQPGV